MPKLKIRKLTDKQLSKELDIMFGTEKPLARGKVQWYVKSQSEFIGAMETIRTLEKGVYSIEADKHTEEVVFKKENYVGENLIHFSDSQTEEILLDSKTFWTLKEEYKKMRMPCKRGYLLHGVAGGGKSTCIKILIEDVIARNGIVLKFTDNPYTFERALAVLREVEREREKLVYMEDLDALISEHSESEILNILDGVVGHDNVIFVATTNYPEKLLGRITNRPSRFDRIYNFKAPGFAIRREYVKKLFEGLEKDIKDKDLTKWADDTDTLTMAHIKELFLSSQLFNNDYEKVLKTLKGMTDNIKGYEEDVKKPVGFD